MRGNFSDFVEEEVFRNEIIKNMSKEDKSRARNIYRKFSAIDWQFRQSILHAFFVATLPSFVSTILIKTENVSFFDSLLQGFLLYVIFFLIIKKALDHFCFGRKAKKLIKDLALELEKNDDLRKVFWLIRKNSEGRSEFNIANQIWQEIVQQEKQRM